MTTTTVPKRRKSRKTYESPEVALQRIQSMQMGENDVLVIHAFADAGIPAEDIDPRENVLTFNAWKALGRRVAKGATSIRVTVWIPATGKAKPEANAHDDGEKPKTSMRPVTARLFHISQTVAADAPKGTKPDAWRNEALVKPGSYDESTDDTDAKPVVEPQAVETNTEPAIETVPVETPASEPETPVVDRPGGCTCPAVGLVTNANCPIHAAERLNR